VVDDGAVVVSQFPPDQPWTVGGAMAGNATMVGLCEALVAIEPASAGAAVDAGMRALALRRPVLAVGDTSGSRLLVDYGATAARDAVELGWWLSRLPRQQKAGLVTVDAP
jgi:DNA processing protein